MRRKSGLQYSLTGDQANLKSTQKLFTFSAPISGFGTPVQNSVYCLRCTAAKNDFL
ncbi:hypothetical protein EMIT0P253_240045 [Pseudomonas sp. IT-P253]